MKKYLFFLLMASQSLYCLAQKNGSQSPYLTKSLTGANINKIEVATSGGNIVVAGANDADARVEVYIKDNQGKILSADQIAGRLSQYDFSVDVSNNKVTAIAKNKDKKWDWKKSLTISFAIYAPKNVSGNLATSGGNINLNDLIGDQQFRTSGGNLTIDNVNGDINGATSGGNIAISNSHDNISVTTSGGNIQASDCSGKISMKTSGGNVHINHVTGNITTVTSGGNIKGDGIEGTLLAKTSGGNVDLNNLSCSLETATSGGSMDLQIVKLGDYVRANNSGGSIDLVLPKDKGIDLHVAGDKIKTGTLYNFSGNTESNRVDGKLNGGGTPVVVRTSGRVNLSLQ